jgi:hypothetical protein
MIAVPETDKANCLTLEEAVHILRNRPEATLDLKDKGSRDHIVMWLQELIALRRFRAATEEARRHLP